MKKIILAIAGLAIAATTFAQKKNVTSAAMALNKKEFAEAIKYITEAENDPSTKDYPKTWFVKASIYMNMQNDPGYKSEAPYRKATEAYKKLIALDDSYKESEVTQGLLISAYNYYNDAVAAYGKKQYQEGHDYAAAAVEIHDMGGGKRFDNKSFDTVASQAMLIQAYSAFYGKMYDKAEPVLLKLKDDPIQGSDNVYWLLSSIYKQNKNDDAQIKILEEGRAKYPDSKGLRNEELNYYIRTGKQDVLIKKLEAAVAGDPNNADLNFNLANGYNTMASAKDKPANADELMKKAEAAYLKAVAAEPDNYLYNHNLGALYFNQASELVSEMNKLGTSDADNKKYDELKKKRDAMFGKALPHLNKTMNALEPKISSLNKDDLFTYQVTLRALKEIYARQNMLDKADEIKKKQDALK